MVSPKSFQIRSLAKRRNRDGAVIGLRLRRPANPLARAPPVPSAGNHAARASGSRPRRRTPGRRRDADRNRHAARRRRRDVGRPTDLRDAGERARGARRRQRVDRPARGGRRANTVISSRRPRKRALRRIERPNRARVSAGPARTSRAPGDGPASGVALVRRLGPSASRHPVAQHAGTARGEPPPQLIVPSGDHEPQSLEPAKNWRDRATVESAVVDVGQAGDRAGCGTSGGPPRTRHGPQVQPVTGDPVDEHHIGLGRRPSTSFSACSPSTRASC